MAKESLTPRERWQAVLDRAVPDRLPMDYWGTDEATARVMKHLGCNTEKEMYEALHIDKVVAVEPVYCGPALAADRDEFGCRFAEVDYGTGLYAECVENPLAAFDDLGAIERGYTWPTADWYDFSGLAKQIEGFDAYPVRGGGSEPFLTYCQLRGLEQAFVDLAADPEMVCACLDKLFDLCHEKTRRILEALPGRIDLCYVAEDFGSQEALLMSPRTIREIFVPRMRRMIELAHEAGARVFFHSDGAVRPILGDMIDAGIDILNPIQWRCAGREREGLKKNFGDKVVFHGGVDNQETLAFGSVDDVEREVEQNVAILGKGGGYILAPCHNIQAITPPENVVALYETGYRLGIEGTW